MTKTIADKVEDFFKAYPLKRFEKGYLLIYAGYDPPGVFLIKSGRVRQYDVAENGEEVVVNVFKPPAFFPMSWAINKTPNKYFFEADSTITARQAPADQAVEFIKANPDVMFDLLSRVYLGTDGLLRRSAHLMASGARTRLLFELITQCRRFGEKQPGGTYLIRISESELAKRAGLSRETVSRQLAVISKQGVVKANRQGITITNLEHLEQELGANL
jgi:CRP-like cAMP-binding protein